MTDVKQDRKVLDEVLSGEIIANDDPVTIEADVNFQVGDNWPQGDLYIVRIHDMPKSAEPRTDRQLAEGNTQGSRHILTSGDVYNVKNPQEVCSAIASVCKGVQINPKYVGPVFQTKAGHARLDHPEHGDLIFKGDMTCAVVFQRSLDAEEREARVRD